MRLPFRLSLLGWLAASPALAGDPDAGRALAERWCANCHVVEASQRDATANGAPTFTAVARMPSTTEVSLKVFLLTPHDRMPDLHLTNAERDNVVSYILSLRPQGS
jgi:mono/diheme cytochrome c family protein